MGIASAVVNGVIFLVTLVLTAGAFRRDGKWDPAGGKETFRFFTCQSNVFCAAAALLMCVFRLSGNVPVWAWALKYIGTVAVTITLMTVLLFLSRFYGLRELLKGSSLFLHLLTPLMALFSFCVLEKRGMSFGFSMLGLLPLLLYGPLYLYKTIYAPVGKSWEDFYQFNRNGKWPVAFAAMLAGTFLICLGIMALQNL